MGRVLCYLVLKEVFYYICTFSTSLYYLVQTSFSSFILSFVDRVFCHWWCKDDEFSYILKFISKYYVWSYFIQYTFYYRAWLTYKTFKNMFSNIPNISAVIFEYKVRTRKGRIFQTRIMDAKYFNWSFSKKNRRGVLFIST